MATTPPDSAAEQVERRDAAGRERRDAAVRRRWGSLDRDQIVAAALDLIAREGIEALSIRRLAAEVGASRMALYRHVADKDALLALVANAIAEDRIITDDALRGPWPDRLRSLAHGMRRQMLAHPGFVDLIMTRSNHGPGGLRLAETILDIIAAAGLDDETTARFYLVFVDIVLGRAHREIHGDPTSPSRNDRLLAAARARPDLPRLHALAGHLETVTAEQIFDTEIDALINAIHKATETSATGKRLNA